MAQTNLIQQTEPARQALPESTGSIIQPSSGWSALGLSDLWEYRELVFYWVVREIQGVYRQTALGISWIFIRPVINMVLLSLVFGGLVGVPSDDLPYPLFSLAALIPWGYCSNAVTRTARSLVDNTQVISKVYFPRMVLPIAASISGLVDLAASLLVFFVAFLLYRMPFRPEMLWLPLLDRGGEDGAWRADHRLAARERPGGRRRQGRAGAASSPVRVRPRAFALAAGLWLATLSVRYRDVSFAITFLLQALMYASPVIYPASLVPAPLQFLYALNPMTGVIQGFRWALLGSGDPPGAMFAANTARIVLGLLAGAFIFRRTERTIVDVL